MEFVQIACLKEVHAETLNVLLQTGWKLKLFANTALQNPKSEESLKSNCEKLPTNHLGAALNADPSLYKQST